MLKYIAYGLILWNFINKKVDEIINNIVWEILPPQLSDIRIGKGELDLRVFVTNKNQFSTVVNAFVGTAWLAGKQISRIETLADIEIASGTSKELKLTLENLGSESILALSQVVGGQAKPVLTIRGQLTVKGGDNQYVKIPMTYNYQF